MAEQPNLPNRTLYPGDCLKLLAGMDSDTVDLIYLDPPFGTARGYHGKPLSDALGASFDDRWRWGDAAAQESAYLETESPAAFIAVALARRTRGDAFGAYLVHLTRRIFELARVLRPGGAFFLHCDPTANSYIRVVLDAVLGARAFRNEVVWRRTGAHNNSRKFGSIHDTIYYYAGEGRTWHPVARPYGGPFGSRKVAPQEDERGAYHLDALLTGRNSKYSATAPSCQPWRRCDPGPYGRIWALPRLALLPEWAALPDDFDSRSPQERLDILDDAGLIFWPESRREPNLKRYVDAMPGRVPQDIITHIWRATFPESTGYPTQKPVALLELLIQVASNPGDLVLDPYCGAGTTLVAAERHGRRWIGADINPEARRVAAERLRNDGWLSTPDAESPVLLSLGEITSPSQPPERTDLFTQETAP